MKSLERLDNTRCDNTRWRSRLASVGASMAIAVAAIGSAFIPSVSKAELHGVLYVGGTAPGDTVGGTKLASDIGFRNVTFNSGAYSSVFSNLTSQPQALWIGGWYQDRRGTASKYVRSALKLGQVPVLLLYYVPFRDCGQASGSGSAPDYDTYNKFISDIAWGIADGVNESISQDRTSPGTYGHPAVPILVMLEPDSIGLVPSPPGTEWYSSSCDWLPKSEPTARFQVLKSAVRTLSSAAGQAPVCDQQLFQETFHRPDSCASWQSRVKVYLDAAHSAWAFSDAWPDEVVSRLDQAGLQDAAGIFTNASNYRLPQNEAIWGKKLIDRISVRYKDVTYECYEVGQRCKLPPKRQIIDTGRSGADVSTGLYVGGDKRQEYQPNGWPIWCDNQKGRLGVTPTLYPNYWTPVFGDLNHVDAFLWLKPPGETDGCWGGPATSPNTQPAATSILLDNGANSQNAAGWSSYYEACGFTDGVFKDPPYLNLSTTQANLLKATMCDVRTGGRFLGAYDTPVPDAPTDVRITDFTMKSNGDPADTVTLQWEPSRGVCAYMVSVRISSNGRSWSAWRTLDYYGNYNAFIATPGNGIGAPTRYVVNPVIRGPVVQYAVRARKCDDVAPTYSGYSTSSSAIQMLFP